ncbi:hypothetical protein [Pontibacter rugosus]|uniref:Type I restriction modification DNA specificity domain-containing protein n=1 Tax=Pontibacter rugosus TaxID=1745966 RepID=A0ABW3SKA4_9BACT
MTWTTNGYGGRVQIISGRFSINGDRGILIPRIEQIPGVDFIKYLLEPILISQAVGRIVEGKKNEYTKVSPEIVAKSILTLPVDEDDIIDYERIERKARKINSIQTIQKSLRKHREILDDAEVVIEIKDPYTTLSLGDERYFSLSIGERVLVKDGLPEGVPAYSANVKVPLTHIAESNIVGFDNPSILWGIDGIFFWNIIPEDVVFATTDHCGRLLINSPELSPDYVYHYLQATRLEYGFDRVFRANLENMKNLVEVKVPLNEKGEVCLKRQQKIAERYKKINALKDMLNEKLDVLQCTHVDINL